MRIPDAQRAQLIKSRDHAVKTIQGLGLCRGTLAVQVQTLERALEQVVDVCKAARDRELRTRAHNLRRAILAIEFEMQQTQIAADHITRLLAERNGVTTP